MRRLAVSASKAEPVWSTAVPKHGLGLFPSGSDARESSCEDGDRMSSWNKRAC